MIYWAPFLHFYQPPTQYHSILSKICAESYRPLLEMLLKHRQAKLTVNICGILTEMLYEHGARDILQGFSHLAGNGQLEFVDSAKYHALLPLIPAEEIRRQIELNRQVNSYYFKEAYRPRGFFPPEMAYSASVAEVVHSLGYDWILISGIACPEQWPADFISDIPCGSSSLKVLYRDDILSNKISFRNLEALSFLQELSNFADKKKDFYVITAMDAETFGHHIKGWEQLFLARLYETIEKLSRKKKPMSKKSLAPVKVVTLSELTGKFPVKITKPAQASSWSTSAEDIRRKNYYPLWKHPANRMHQLQWKHLGITLKLVEEISALSKLSDEANRFAVTARDYLDQALHSCQFWWASKEHGFWNIDLINRGLILQEQALGYAYKVLNMFAQSHREREDLTQRLLSSRRTANTIRDILFSVSGK